MKIENLVAVAEVLGQNSERALNQLPLSAMEEELMKCGDENLHSRLVEGAISPSHTINSWL